jgi:uncharacterized protein (TIGR03437 family)
MQPISSRRSSLRWLIPCLMMAAFLPSMASAQCVPGFTFTPPGPIGFAAAGSNGGSILLNIGVGCMWTASSSLPWATLINSSGTGTAQVAFNVTANNTGVTRTGNVIIAGVTITLSQASTVGCTPTFTFTPPGPISFVAAGQTGTVALTLPSACPWTAASTLPWAPLAAGSSSGTGPAQVAFLVPANTTGATRTGHVTIAGVTITLTQASNVPCTPTFLFTPPGLVGFAATGQTGSIALTLPSACPWTAVSTLPWAPLAPGSSSGVGSAQVAFVVPANTTGVTRTGSVLIAGVTINLIQTSAPPAVTLNCDPTTGPTTLGVPYTTTCTVSGGVAPYTFGANPPNSLPAGLTGSLPSPTALRISGSPTQLGAYSFGVQVRDSSSPQLTATVTFTGTIAVPATTITRVKSATEFGGFTAFSSGTYIEIAGTALSDTTRVWEGRDFVSGGLLAPTVLDGVRVTINGIPAFIYYISPTQLNVVTPADTTNGMVEIKVTTPSGRTATSQVQKAAVTPGLLLPASFSASGRQYLAAQHPDHVYVGRVGLVSGVPFRPVKPGETITVYGLGFGDVAPYFAPGSVATQANQLVLPLTVAFDSTPATLTYMGLAPNFVNLYQFNITVPAALADGDYRINATLGGQALQQPPFFLTVQR